MSKKTDIFLIDFGSQTTHLISRRLKEFSINCTIIEPDKTEELFSNKDYKGIILSGGPDSVYEQNAPTVNPKIFTLKKPILGICYGMQLTAHLLKGKVKFGKHHELGPAKIKVDNKSAIFKSSKENLIADEFSVWMSHGDTVSTPPTGFKIIADTSTTPNAAMANEKTKIYCLQFHPEVIHTQFGENILKNFAQICGMEPKQEEISKSYVQSLVQDIKESIGNEKAVCALSGGVDSSVAALLVHEAIGKKLTSIYVDTGLMRADETANLSKIFKEQKHMNIRIVNAKKIFLKNLKGVIDPEKKRKVIGKTFIDVLQAEAKKINAKFLVQGTIYPDVIESAGTKHSHNIKSHHNVGGLPKSLKLTLVEPLRTFYKDEVRQIGKLLGLPDTIIKRHPFPGPGLGVRILGEITEYKVKVLQQADKIVTEEIVKANLYEKIWQLGTIFTGIKTTGVKGDARFYGETIAVRAVFAKDAMSAKFAEIPFEVLDKISVRVVNEVKEVNRVVYDITNKPPGTIEWE